MLPIYNTFKVLKIVKLKYIHCHSITTTMVINHTDFFFFFAVVWIISLTSDFCLIKVKMQMFEKPNNQL